jgi:hypothetical protein
MRKLLPTLFVTILGCTFYLSSLYLYRQDIQKRDTEITFAAKLVKDRLDRFNLDTIIKDNEIIKNDLIKIRKTFDRIEEKLNAKPGVSK